MKREFQNCHFTEESRECHLFSLRFSTTKKLNLFSALGEFLLGEKRSSQSEDSSELHEIKCYNFWLSARVYSKQHSLSLDGRALPPAACCHQPSHIHIYISDSFSSKTSFDITHLHRGIKMSESGSSGWESEEGEEGSFCRRRRLPPAYDRL